jgi:hypothetical protein
VFVILPDRHAGLGVVQDNEYIYLENLGNGRWDSRKVDAEEAKALKKAGRVT